MTLQKVAIVLGASGAAGQALIEAIAASGQFSAIHTITRKRLEERVAAKAAPASLHQTTGADFTPAFVKSAVVTSLAGVGQAVGFSTLGVGAQTSRMTLEEHRAVDVALNEAFAQGLKASGKVAHLVFMSAVNADPNAKTTGSGAAGFARYNHVKGEAEEAVKRAGLEAISIFRPSMIIGSPHTPAWIGHVFPLIAFLLPARLRAIRITDLGQAMARRGAQEVHDSRIFHRPEMLALLQAK